MTLAQRRTAACSLPTGGTCRKNPIPVGVYWIDSIDPYGNFGEQDVDAIQAAREAYMLGIESNYANCYRIVKSVHHDATYLTGDLEPARDWILFEVTCPIPRWSPDTKWGLPTVAPKGLNTEESDTVYNEPTPSILDSGNAVPTWAWIAVGGLGVLGVLYALK